MLRFRNKGVDEFPGARRSERKPKSRVADFLSLLRPRLAARAAQIVLFSARFRLKLVLIGAEETRNW